MNSVLPTHRNDATFDKYPVANAADADGRSVPIVTTRGDYGYVGRIDLNFNTAGDNIRLLTLCQKLGATILRNTVVALRDGSMVNFLYPVDGLKYFSIEAEKAVEIEHEGVKLKVLRLEQIIQNKEFAGRPRDLAVLPLLRETLESQRDLKGAR